MLRARLATAAVAIPLLLALIFWAPVWMFSAVVALLAVLALAEYAALAFSAETGTRVLTVALGSILVVASFGGPGRGVLAALTGITVLGLVWTVVGHVDHRRRLGDLGLVLVGIFYAAYLLPHFIWLRMIDGGPEWVTFVIVVGMAGDTGGYFAGRAFGRHRLTPRLSPGKTVEGAVGIVAFGVLGGALAGLVLLPERSLGELAALALVMSIVGQLGDLSESVVKRSFGAKESGWIFPGHGGVLDRIDSLLFPVSLLYYYLTGFV